MKATSEELEKIHVLSTLKQKLLTQLCLDSHIQFYQSGEIIIHEGDLFLPKLYAVLEGKLSVQKTSFTGKETILRQLNSGEMFAAPALFGDCIAPATVVSLQDAKVVTIDKENLLQAIQVNPDVALKILSCFNQRLQEMHQTIHGLISEKAIVRLVRLIIYTTQRYGFEETKEGIHLSNQLPYQQMARSIGITYEECVRLVKKDLNNIVIYRRGGNITITSLPNLEQVISPID